MKKKIVKTISVNRFQLKIIFTACMILVPMLIVVSIFFFQTKSRLQQKEIQSLYFNAKEVQSKIDESIGAVYNISNAVATNSQVTDILETPYGEKKIIEKRAAIQRLNNKLFANYEMLRRNERVAAIYVYRTIGKELYNFSDPNCDGEEQYEKLEQMNLQDKSRLSMFYWYPVQKNFLKKDNFGEIRKDFVVYGTRRIYSNLKSGYPYVHIFAIKEESLYKKYEMVQEHINGTICILNGKGELLSASEESWVKQGKIEEDLKQKILNRPKKNFTAKYNGEEYSFSVCESEINDWMTVVMLPKKILVQTINKLYIRITWIFIIGLLSCCGIIVYMYKRFMSPLALLNESMKQVHSGNLNAYIPVKSDNEIGQMLQYYNDMLESIQLNLERQLQLEKKKKELEMAVLNAQINPHFLYNTLETIVWKAMDARRQDIGKIAASLGRMYRLSINNGNIAVMITQELEHIMAYINIQKSRYEDQFTFDIRVKDEEIEGLYMLKLVMQPVVENSFLYGMEELDRIMNIRLSIRVKENTVKIVVIDNGVGMGKEKLRQVRDQIVNGRCSETGENKRRSSGIGLNNVYSRLQLYFGVENGLQIYSKKGMGTMCVIQVPKLTKEQIKQLI